MISLLLALASAACAEPSLVLTGGKVWVEPGKIVEAVAVEDGRIAAVGSNADIFKLAGPKTRLVELRGRSVVPGFHDSHAHFMKGSLGLLYPDLNGATSVAEVQSRVRAWMAKNPDKEWVLGRGWDHTAFSPAVYPTKADLDAVVSTRPVVLTHTDGHMLWLNSEALRRAGIRPDSKDPAGAHIVRDSSGVPTGIIEKEASALLPGVEPEPDTATLRLALEAGIRHANRWGVTSVQGMLDVEPDAQLAVWSELSKEGKLTLRFNVWTILDDPGTARRWRKESSDIPSDRFRIWGAKGFVDGVLSNDTGALLEPYSDSSTTRGKAHYDLDKLTEEVETAHRNGLQAVMHAVGDRAVRLALDACEASERRTYASLPVYPCKIEHIEVVSPEDLPRFAKLRVVASMQPSHMTYDNEEENYNPARLGDRVKYAFAWRSLEKAGALLVFGTDWPVVPLEPRVELFAAVTREHFNGKPPEGWVPEQKVTLENALRHYTLDPAKAVGRDAELGTLEPGKLADLVVLDRDLFATEGLDLLKLDTDLTVFDGQVVYER